MTRGVDMKPAIRTISYIVYPPDYSPGDGYKFAKNFLQAKRYARQFGAGATIYRELRILNKRRSIRDLGVDEYTYHGGKI